MLVLSFFLTNFTRLLNNFSSLSADNSASASLVAVVSLYPFGTLVSSGVSEREESLVALMRRLILGGV